MTRGRAWLLFGGVALAVILVHVTEVGTWKGTQWLFSYDALGFVKRGLVGTLFTWVDPAPHTAGDIRLAASILLGGVGWAMVLVTVSFASAQHPLAGAALGLVFLTSPATLSALADDFARFDTLLVLITIAVLLVVVDRELTLRRLTGVALLCVIATLIHEAFLFTTLPALLATLALSARARGARPYRVLGRALGRALGVVLVPVGAVACLLVLAGTPGSMTRPEIAAVLQGTTDIAVRADSIDVLLRTVMDNLRLGLEFFPGPDGGTGLVIGGVASVPTWLVAAFLWHVVIRERPWGPIGKGYALIIPLACLSGLGLFATAIDYGRWISLATINLFLVVFVLIARYRVRIPFGRSDLVISGVVIAWSLLTAPMYYTGEALLTLAYASANVLRGLLGG